MLTLATLVASPRVAALEMAENPNSALSYGARSQLARELTEVWHNKFGSRWAVVAGTTEIGEPMELHNGSARRKRASMRVRTERGSQKVK